MVFGCAGRGCDGAGIYHGDRAVHGKQKHRGGGILFSETHENDGADFLCMESFDFSADAAFP